jgi:hypothetical protein
MIPCNSDDEVGDSWTYTSQNQFKHESTGLCIGAFVIIHQLISNSSFNFLPDRKNLDKKYVHAAVCDSNSKTQKWEFQKNDKIIEA